MNKFFILGSILLSTTAFSSEFLLKSSQRSGFTPFPYSKDLTIAETGDVVQTITTNREMTKRELKKLSPNTIQKIKDDISAIKSTDKSIDLDANKPRCMDAPTDTYSIMKNGKEKEIGGFSGCHHFAMKNKAAAELIQILNKVEASDK
jgi:uncharacterized ParB-like nuclease family protein